MPAALAVAASTAFQLRVCTGKVCKKQGSPQVRAAWVAGWTGRGLWLAAPTLIMGALPPPPLCHPSSRADLLLTPCCSGRLLLAFLGQVLPPTPVCLPHSLCHAPSPPRCPPNTHPPLPTTFRSQSSPRTCNSLRLRCRRAAASASAGEADGARTGAVATPACTPRLLYCLGETRLAGRMQTP